MIGGDIHDRSTVAGTDRLVPLNAATLGGRQSSHYGGYGDEWADEGEDEDE